MSLVKGIFFLSFFSLSWAEAQVDSLVGYVKDGESNALEYVNIGLNGRPIGTVSDQDGRFKIHFNRGSISSIDTLIASKIGYKSKAYFFSNLTDILKEGNGLEISLHVKIEMLEEVKITSNKTKTKNIGSKGHSLLNMHVNLSISGYKDQNLGVEIGRFFNIGNHGARLNSCMFYISHNNFDSLKFRVNIYSLKKGYPDKNLLQKEVLIDVLNAGTGWVEVDLSKYYIEVNEDIVVGIEWISKSNNGSQLTFPIIMPTTHVHFYKYGSQNDWKKYPSMTSMMRLNISY